MAGRGNPAAEKLERYMTHLFGRSPKLRFVNHHRAHAASAYYALGFEDSMISTTDLSGNGISTLGPYVLEKPN